MENISYVGLSQQMSLHKLMEVTANNLANMDTPGFKSQNVLFKEYVNKAENAQNTVSQVQDYGTYRDMGQGTLMSTSNSLDAAIEGEGYFVVKTPDGARYTRNGAFSMNKNRELVTKTGHLVMNETGNAITIQPGASQITIAENGTVSTELGTLSKLKVVTFGNPQNFKPDGNNLFDAKNAQEKPVERPQVVQGMLERSNVQPILEMNKMIEILRLYQASQNMLMQDHDRIRGVIQKLTKT